MIDHNIAGGRGVCRKCQQWTNNVSLHETLCGESAEELTEAFPVTIYFMTRKDADEFIAAVKEVNPNLTFHAPR